MFNAALLMCFFIPVHINKDLTDVLAKNYRSFLLVIRKQTLTENIFSRIFHFTLFFPHFGRKGHVRALLKEQAVLMDSFLL